MADLLKAYMEKSEELDNLLKKVPKDFVKSYATIQAAKLLTKAIKLTKEK